MRCFLALDKSLAYARHYPAINWTMSYSEYYEDLDPYYTEHLGEKSSAPCAAASWACSARKTS